MFDSTSPDQPSILGGMSPYLRAALQAIAGGFAGTAAAQRSGARGFGAGLGPGAMGGMQYGLEMQQAARRNKLADQQIKYQGLEGQNLQSQIDARNAMLKARQDVFGWLNGGSTLPSSQGGIPAGAGDGTASLGTAALAASPQASAARTAGQGAAGDQPGGVPQAQAQAQPRWQKLLTASEYLAGVGDAEGASNYRALAEADPDYQAAKAMGLIPADVAKEVAVSNATLGNKIAVAQAGRTYVNTPTQIINQQESAASQGIGQGIAKVYNDIQDVGRKSSATAANWDRLGALLGNIKTGKYTGTVNDFAKSLQSFGIDPTSLGITNNTALVDAATAASNQLALQLRNPSGGAGMPGSLSDPDRAFLTASTPSVESSPNAIPLMVKWQKKLVQRDAEIARVAREYKASSLPGKPPGIIDDGVYDAIQKYADTHPLFTKDDAAEVQKLSGASGQIGQGMQFDYDPATGAFKQRQ